MKTLDPSLFFSEKMKSFSYGVTIDGVIVDKNPYDHFTNGDINAEMVFLGSNS